MFNLTTCSEGINGWKLMNINLKSLLYLGVLQGSHLSPLLFALFINDVKEIVPNYNILAFEGNLNIFRQISNGSDCLLLQEKLTTSVNWFKSNGLYLNVNKCQSIFFTRSRTLIDHTYSINNIDLSIIERVYTQWRFLSYAWYVLNIPHTTNDYSPALHELSTLADRKVILNQSFLIITINGSAPMHLTLINFCVLPRRTRFTATFAIPMQTTNL